MVERFRESISSLRLNREIAIELEELIDLPNKYLKLDYSAAIQYVNVLQQDHDGENGLIAGFANNY